MEEFDYKTAVGQLESLERKIQDPATPLSEVEGLIAQASELIAKCRQYLRTIREGYEENL